MGNYATALRFLRIVAAHDRRKSPPEILQKCKPAGFFDAAVRYAMALMFQ